MKPDIHLTVATLAVLMLGGGCLKTRTDSPARETSVQPGINASFLGDEVDIERYRKIFEEETREVAQHRAAIVTALAVEPGHEVADIGAGTGLFAEALHDAIGPDGTYYAVDISKAFLFDLRLRFGAQLDRMRIVRNNGWITGLPATSVDTAFICDTYHHFEQPEAMLASLFETVRPGGQLVVVDFERIPGVTREWLLEHVRAGKDVFRSEIEAAGFVYEAELLDDTLDENYFIRFRRPK